MTEGPEEEGCEITFVETEHIAIFRNGIFPLLQVDIRLGLQET